MKRIAYYGTWGRPGHIFVAIRGEFSAEEIRGITNIDSDIYIEATAIEGFHYYGFGNFLGYGIPFSIDDRRPGCITAVFVEHAATPEDIRLLLFVPAYFAPSLPHPIPPPYFIRNFCYLVTKCLQR